MDWSQPRRTWYVSTDLDGRDDPAAECRRLLGVARAAVGAPVAEPPADERLDAADLHGADDDAWTP